MIRKVRRVMHAVATFLGLLPTLLLPTNYSTVHAAPQAPLDTPTPLVNDNFASWILKDGMLYWATECFGGEFRNSVTLKRKAVNSALIRTLSDVSALKCLTFRNMAADATGIYYYNYDDSQIEFRPSGSPYDPPTPVLKSVSGIATELAIDGDNLYWVDPKGKLVRVHTDGSSFTEVLTTGLNPNSLLVNQGNAYWLDDTGLWTANVACAAPPCAKNKLLDTKGNNLYRYVADALSSSLYWVEYGKAANDPPKLRRYSCSILACTTTTIYTALNTNWTIGQMATNGSDLFWPESFYDNNTSAHDGVLRKLAAGKSIPVDIAVNLPNIGLDLALDNANVYFGVYAGAPNQTASGIYGLPFTAGGITRDLAADALEITQGVQNLANDVPLVARKTTYVRAYAKANNGPTAGAVEAWLYGTRNGNPLPGSPLSPLNGVRSLTTGVNYNRATLDDGWLFQVPSSWVTAGNTNFRLVVDPRQNYNDTNRANNELARAMNFATKPPVCDVFVPVRTHSPYASTDNPNFGAMVDQARRLFPTYDFWSFRQTDDVAELEACWWGPFPYPCFGPYELPDDSWKVLTALNTRDFFTDDPDACDNVGAETHYAGMVHASTDTHNPDNPSFTTTGSSYINDNVIWVKFPSASLPSNNNVDFPDAVATLAHELGHNEGRKHVNCGNPDDPDSNYPYPTTQIDNTGAANHYGFDIRTQKVIAPTTAKDFMTYCSTKWTSDYTWKAIFNRLSAQDYVAGVMGPSDGATPVDGSTPSISTGPTPIAVPNLAAANAAIFVTGAVTPSLNTGALNYAWVYPTAALSSGILRKWQAAADKAAAQAINAAQADQPQHGGPIAGNYHVQLLDSANTVLADQPVTPQDSSIHNMEDSAATFVATFPAPGDKVATIQLLNGNSVIASRSPGATQPTVTISKPTGGETFTDQMQVVWRGDDADQNDILLYSVQYSPNNGQSWFALVSDYPGVQNSDTVTLTLTNLSIPGSLPNQGLIRVAASDGYNTGLAISAPFTVTNRKPEPYITAPAPNATFPAGKPVTLIGDANDAEDGGLSGNSLQWQVAGQNVGAGEEVVVNGLAPGAYPVTLTAIDTKTLTATAQATLTILPLGIPADAAPVIDGVCDDVGYGTGAGYGTSTQVQLKPYSDGTQATARLVRSADALWACFSGLKLGGPNPSDEVGLRVDVDNSRDAQMQSNDYSFLVAEDGGLSTYAGDGAGNLVAGPGGLQAQINVNANGWNAELRIDAAKLGGWQHFIGLEVGHYNLSKSGDDYLWPYAAGNHQPNTWAKTALGDQPQIETVSPGSAIAGGPGFSLVATGTNFLTSTVVLWDGAPVPTTFGSSTQVTATISTANIATARNVPVVARNPGNLASNPFSFLVQNPTPTISNLTPDTAAAGSGLVTITVNGSNFVNGAQILWNQTPLPTTFVSNAQLTVQVKIDAAGAAQAAGVTVLNPAPDSQSSNTTPFVVQPQATSSTRLIYLPLVVK